MNNINQLLFFRFIMLSLSQVMIFNNFLIFENTVNIYLIFVLVFPLNFNKSLAYIITFIFGFVIDFFSNSFGIITFSLLISILIKPSVIKFAFGHFDVNKVRKTSEYISGTSLYQQLSYLFLMFFTHQLILNTVEIFSLQNFDMILNKTLISSIISIIFSYFLLLIFFRKNA
ncbi:MAG: hypothetical protein CMC45_02545 [Flavobacteriaceae bacterium]|nr:hypothetical protein [Flavobacteriaceae bacterium]